MSCCWSGSAGWREHADVWRVFEDGAALDAVVRALVAPFRAAGVTAVAGVESRGFLLGGAAARELGVGFVAVRKAEGLYPGEKLVRATDPDCRGHRHTLRRASLAPGGRLLLVDDWIETGSQAGAVRELVRAAGAAWAGCSVLVDEAGSEVRRALGPVHAVVSARELPPPG